MAFKFAIRDTVGIKISAEQGRVLGRAEYELSQNSYLVRYKGADGMAKEEWWGEDALYGVSTAAPANDTGS